MVYFIYHEGLNKCMVVWMWYEVVFLVIVTRGSHLLSCSCMWPRCALDYKHMRWQVQELGGILLVKITLREEGIVGKGIPSHNKKIKVSKCAILCIM